MMSRFRNTPMWVFLVALLTMEIHLLLNYAYAATCTAECGGGRSVTCSGRGCFAGDGLGCMSWDKEGNVSEVEHC